MSEVMVTGRTGNRVMDVSFGGMKLTVDRDAQSVRSVDLLLTALGSCTLAAVAAYLNRKGIDPGQISVGLSASKIDGADHYGHFSVKVDCGDAIDDQTRKILHEVCRTCTIHKTLHANPEIEVNVI